ncbi:MAG: YccF domain-containing protein [Woeseiaceae bacterium]|nr:YccF domain-containing protein [Woeseiaceae bacterium]
MTLLGNIVFFVFGGFAIFLGYVLGGIVLCLTIIGIPFGIQCFKLAGGVIAPFGREVYEKDPPGGSLAVVLNIIWIILPGLELAVMHLLLALLFALTIVGIPIASQHMKLLPLALLPFGRGMRDAQTGRECP